MTSMVFFNIDAVTPSNYLPGDEIGPYVLQKEIGSGAFSTVFEAKVEALPNARKQSVSSVAVKIISKSSPVSSTASQPSSTPVNQYQSPQMSPQDMEPIVAEIVDHETCIWKCLQHPNIISLHDVVEAEDSIFVVLPSLNLD